MLSIQQFGDSAVAAGLLTLDELQAFLAAIPAELQPSDGAALATALVQAKRLTQYQADELLAGRTDSLVLGDYVILDKLGAGGMGDVFKARHRHMDRLVAIKVVNAKALKDEASAKRFQREVKAAARLEHPNIVAAHDSRFDHGTHYLVMQYVDGRDLTQLVRERGALPVELAIECIVQAARGLAYAHAEGVVHRDVKPTNMLLDKRGVVKVLDMGLARLDDASTDDLTGTEQVMGTVDYMSPEQAASTHDVDGRADIYSLGCTLWFLLTGRKIYEGDSLMSRMLKHREAPIPSLCVVEGVQSELDHVFQKMVAKLPDDRFKTMEDVVRELESLQTNTSGLSKIASTGTGSLNLLNDFAKGLPATHATNQATLKRVAAQPSMGNTPTIDFRKPEVGTDPKSEISVEPLKKQTNDGEKKPPLKRIAVGGAGFLALCLAVWIILRNDKGQEVGRLAVEVPKGGSIEVRNEQPEPAEPAKSTKTGGVTDDAASPVVAPTSARKPITTFKDPAFQQWVKDAAALPAEDQVKAVIKKLQEIHPGYDSPVTHRIENGVVTRLQVTIDRDLDISPVRALPGLKDLSFVRMTEKNFRLDLSPLEGLPLTALYCGVGVTVSDLSALRGMPLTSLAVKGDYQRPSQPLSDLSPLEGMPLVFFSCLNSTVSDLSVLQGMPLKVFVCNAYDVVDLSPLARCKQLRLLDIQHARLTAAEVAQLQEALPECKAVWGSRMKPTVAGATIPTPLITTFSEPAFQQWQQEVSELSAEDQVKAVINKLQDLNPGFNGREVHRIERKVVTELESSLFNFSDASPVRALAGLKRLNLASFSGLHERYILDLSPLKGMQLIELQCGNVFDLSPLNGMQLTSLRAGGRQLSDLTPLKGMPLTSLAVIESAVDDLSPLKGMSLQSLYCNYSQVADLSPLQGMPLKFLACGNTMISDLSPLRGMPLEDLRCANNPQVGDLSPLEDCKDLKSLSVKGTKVTEAAIAALQKALPNCKIEWDDPAQAKNP